MLRRNREINVFNLSLMDVICGAMGAFLIVTVVLSNYYEADPQRIEGTAKIRHDLDAALALVSTLGAKLEAAESRTEGADPAESSAGGTPPPMSFALMTYWAGRGTVDTWLIPDMAPDNTARPEFRDLHLPEEQRSIRPVPSTGAENATYTRPRRFPIPATLWVVWDARPGLRYRIYLDTGEEEQLANLPTTASAGMELVGPRGDLHFLENISLGQSWEHSWRFAGILEIAPDGAATLTAATDEEHEQEKERLGL